MVQGSLGTAWMVDGHRTFFSWSLARNQRNQRLLEGLGQDFHAGKAVVFSGPLPLGVGRASGGGSYREPSWGLWRLCVRSLICRRYLERGLRDCHSGLLIAARVHVCLTPRLPEMMVSSDQAI